METEKPGCPPGKNDIPRYIDRGEDEIHLVDLVIVLLKHKKLIIGIVLFAIVASVTISLIIPNEYTATASILPPKDSGSAMSAALSQASGALGGLASQFAGGGKSSSDVYVGILESRTVADTLITKFDLKKVYDQELLQDVYNTLKEKRKFELSQTSQIVTVSVTDVNPERAAQMANAYVEALGQINMTVNTTEGQRKRVFLERRLEGVKVDLAKAETTLKEFQEKYKVVAIEEQAKATIEGAAVIIGQLIAAQTELEVLRQFGTERQNEAVMLRSKIGELQKQLTKIESGIQAKTSS